MNRTLRHKDNKIKRTYGVMLGLLLCTVVIFVLVLTAALGKDTLGADDDVPLTEDVHAASETILSSEEWKEIAPGTIVGASQIDWDYLEQYFTVEEPDEELHAYIQGKSYVDNGEISWTQLRYLKVLHYNYSHELQVGELLVNQQIAEVCCNIFRELFENEYEINSMYLVDRYYNTSELAARDPDMADINSLNNNNTSAFHYRYVSDSDVLSQHAYGLAIDINPLQNPYVTQEAQETQTSSGPYLMYQVYQDRSVIREHMITHDDICYQIFTKYGFTWGGDWPGTKDYQHFEIAL